MIEKIKRRIVSLFEYKYSRDDVVAQNKGERQAAKTLKGIREDHKNRYRLALNYIQHNTIILDMACGIGYGSYIIATKKKIKQIDSVDISQEAIAYAKKYYGKSNINFIQGNALTLILKEDKYDVAISFETIEHVEDDNSLLQQFYRALKKDGFLICSTPNEKNMPFDKIKFPHHIKHYEPKKIKAMIEKNGFRVVDVYEQKDNLIGKPEKGEEGLFNIYVAQKV